MNEARLIHVLAAEAREGEAFLTANPSLADQVEIAAGFVSPGALINNLVETAPAPYICLAHSDVYLRTDFPKLLVRLAVVLNSEYPNWGVAGNQAVIPFGVGWGGMDIVRYLADPQGPPNLVGHIMPAQIIGGSLIFLNLEALHRRRLALPPSASWSDYAILLSVETIRADLGVFICPQLALWHDCRHRTDSLKQEKTPDKTREHLRQVLKNRRLKTLKGVIGLDVKLDYVGADQRLDLEMASLRSAASGRPHKTLALVIRTRFDRPKSYLTRTIGTAKAFVAATGGSIKCGIHIVTDKKPLSLAEYDGLLDGVEIHEAYLPEINDSRYLLVKHAADEIEADHFWFIDDDDWIFPNEAERLALIISVVPGESLIFLDCRHFYETVGPAGNEASGNAKAGKIFLAKNFIISLTGQNQTPFCGVIYPRSLFGAIPDQCFQTVVYAEDFMSTMFALLMGHYLPVVVDKLFTGISIRPSGNTVTEKDRRNWRYANSAIFSHLVNMPGGPQIMSLPINSLMNRMTRWGLPDSAPLFFRYLTMPLRRLVIRWNIPHYAWLRWVYGKSEIIFTKLVSRIIAS